jgi:hypothetical protein
MRFGCGSSMVREREREMMMMTLVHVGPSRRGCQARMHHACEVWEQRAFLFRFLTENLLQQYINHNVTSNEPVCPSSLQSIAGHPRADTKPRPPAIRACLFDMDGLLIDSEDLYTVCTNETLRKYGKPDLPWNIKAQLQGRPGPEVRTRLTPATHPLMPQELTHTTHRPARSSTTGPNSPSPAKTSSNKPPYCNKNTFPPPNPSPACAIF